MGTDGGNGGVYSAAALAAKCGEIWGPTREHRLVVLTGGEPMLQVDPVLIDTLHRFGFSVAVETNGTRRCPESLDWITVSPKAGSQLVQTTGQELKLVYPQVAAEPDRFAGTAFRHFLLSPMDGPERVQNTRAALEYCLANPPWRLSLQVHKVLGIP